MSPEETRNNLHLQADLWTMKCALADVFQHLPSRGDHISAETAWEDGRKIGELTAQPRDPIPVSNQKCSEADPQRVFFVPLRAWE